MCVQRGAEINRDKLREIEDKDAELARVMQEEEKVKAQKRQQKRASRHHPSRNHAPHSPVSIVTGVRGVCYRVCQRGVL